MIKPRALKKGDTIGIVAPAGVVNEKELDRGTARLKEMGFRVKIGTSVKKRERYMAGTDRERAEDINRMFSDASVTAVLCARGGYGTMRLFPHLDEGIIRGNPKIFVGSSDVTLLINYLRKKFKLVAFHGPMVASNFGRVQSELTESWFLNVLGGGVAGEAASIGGFTGLKPGKAQGPLAGGCLSIISSSLGTPYEVSTEGAILLLEDVNEAPYRIDRMLTQLKTASRLRSVRGVIVGTMPGCEPPSDAGYTLEDLFREGLDEVQGPVIYGFPAGHGGEQITLPLGLPVELDGESGTLTLSESPVGMEERE